MLKMCLWMNMAALKAFNFGLLKTHYCKTTFIRKDFIFASWEQK